MKSFAVIVLLFVLLSTATATCTNADLDKIDDWDNFVKQQTYCGLDCLLVSDENLDSCFTTCLAKNLEVTTACASCFGDYVSCGRIECAESCQKSYEEDQACGICVSKKCVDTYTSCLLP